MLKILRWIEQPAMALCRWVAKRKGGPLGDLGAYYYDAAIDTWDRHRAVARQLLRLLGNENRQRLILDVGGIPGLLSQMLPDRWVVVTCNLEGVADRCPREDGSLPAGGGEFDAVVSLDTLEHVPPDKRKRFLLEMRRASAGPVIVHVPANGGWIQGILYDVKFQAAHKVLTGKVDRHTREHQDLGLPHVTELRALLRGAEFHPRQPGRTWLKAMILERIPFVRLLAVPLLAEQIQPDPGRGGEECRAVMVVLER